MDPFETLGVEPSLDLDADDLEVRYLKLSREYHPDFHIGAAPETMSEILAKSADINRAYKILQDRWERARSLVERLDPEAMKRTEKLDPMFLMEAMEWAEAVAEGRGDAALETQLAERVEADFEVVRRHLTEHNANAAATALHQSRYARKALSDLRAFA